MKIERIQLLKIKKNTITVTFFLQVQIEVPGSPVFVMKLAKK